MQADLDLQAGFEYSYAPENVYERAIAARGLPPDDFTPEQKRIWAQICHDLGEWLLKSDWAVIEAACVALSRARDARRIIHEEGMLTEGSRGQKVRHPALAIEREQTLMFFKLASKLRLSTSTVGRLNDAAPLTPTEEMISVLGPSPLHVPPSEADFEGEGLA